MIKIVPKITMLLRQCTTCHVSVPLVTSVYHFSKAYLNFKDVYYLHIYIWCLSKHKYLLTRNDYISALKIEISSLRNKHNGRSNESFSHYAAVHKGYQISKTICTCQSDLQASQQHLSLAIRWANCSSFVCQGLYEGNFRLDNRRLAKNVQT